MKHEERRIENLILFFLNDCGLTIWKNETFGRYNAKYKTFLPLHGPFKGTGSPDIIGLLPTGRLLGIEVKSANGKQSPAQKAFQERINSSNGLSFVARSVRDVYNSLKEAYPEIEQHSHLVRKYEVHEP